MEIEETLPGTTTDTNAERPTKKVRLWSATEFRNKLKSAGKLAALQQFLEICKDEQKQDCILEYLECGGSCMELFELLQDTEISVVTILEIVNYLLLQIISSQQTFDSSTFESCKYFLQSHLASINKMVALGSPRADKKVVLKLLTSIVTFSSILAKEILLHVNFNSSNIEVLTKQTQEKDSIRNVFINFLMSFLVEGEYSTVSILLDKKPLLWSIFKGLQYDPHKTVVVVMSTLRTYVLENSSVSKTTKMGIFKTAVVKDIVNLYNWKGPQSFNSKNLQNTTVDPEKKVAVNECVHGFLLVLCTSHKFGVIFKDPYVGLRPKPCNNLMHTVLESLDRPWEHSYAGDLVTKICGACPDLVNTMWTNLKTFLEPRHTAKWLHAVKYAVVLVRELQPANIDFSSSTLNVHQLTYVIQSLAAPTSILKTMIPENRTFEKPIIKYHVITLLVECLKAVRNYLTVSQNLNSPDFHILKNALREHIYKHFLNAEEVVRDWVQQDDDRSVVDHLKIVLELLDLYATMCPQLLEGLNNLNLKSLLDDIQQLQDANILSLQIRAIKLFLNFDPSTFTPKSESFPFILSLVLKYYFETKDRDAYTTLYSLYKNLGIFEGCLEEIDIWINAILDLNDLDDVSEILVGIVRECYEKIFENVLEMQKLSNDYEVEIEKQHLQSILESMQEASFRSDSLTVKHSRLSPLLIGALKYIQNIEQSKSFKTFINSVLVNLLHVQTSSRLISSVISHDRYRGLISKSVQNYIKRWTSGESCVLVKTKLVVIQNFNNHFINGNVDDFFDNYTNEMDQQQLKYRLNQALFYFTHLNSELLTEAHLENCLKVMRRFGSNDELIRSVFGHPVLLERFSPQRMATTNRLLIEGIKHIQTSGLNVDAHLKPFRSKLLTSLKKLLKKHKKLHCIMENLTGFGLDHDQCVHILQICSELDITGFEDDFLECYYNVVVYVLQKYLVKLDIANPLDKNVVSSISRLLTFLNRAEFDTSMCSCTFQKYLEFFPHCIKFVNSDTFESILLKNRICEDEFLFAGFLLRRRVDFVNLFVEHLGGIAKKKETLLSLIKSAIEISASEEILQACYAAFEFSLVEALEKPKKAERYFNMYKDVLIVLITKFMHVNYCLPFAEKVLKFDGTEVYHMHMLAAIFDKILSSDVMSEAHANNVILTLALATNLLYAKKQKSDEDWVKLEKVTELSRGVFAKLHDLKDVSFRSVCENEAFNLYCTFSLKFGLSGKVALIRAFKVLLQFLDFKENEARVLMEMTGSHSEFLELILGNDCEAKTELLDLILVFCKRWPALMQRNHVPVLLSSYCGTIGATDRVILTLLQMYEKEADRTNFYDFKPFLWGKAAATHYSVRHDVQRALWRQPKMFDILEILEESKINSTICNHPLAINLTNTNEMFNSNENMENVYNLAFFLPLFASLLAPENQVAIHAFIKSGALSLTILGLSCDNKDIRLASCHVLARYHYHLEARHAGKGKVLSLNFVEALCRAVATLEDFKLNNFCSIFWAKMALILTCPTLPMYVPLSRYLTAKPTPDLSGIPELYTFLHIPDVNFKEPRSFILKILRDGMRTDHDCSIALYKMVFKLIMELFSSCLSDLDTKVTVLTIIERACRLKVGIEMLSSKYGLLSWLYEIANIHCNESAIISLVVQILHNLTKISSKFFDAKIAKLIVIAIIDGDLIATIRKENLNQFLQVVLELFSASHSFLTEERMQILIAVNDDKKCNYLFQYGSECAVYKEEDSLMQLLIRKWVNKR